MKVFKNIISKDDMLSAIVGTCEPQEEQIEHEEDFKRSPGRPACGRKEPIRFIQSNNETPLPCRIADIVAMEQQLMDRLERLVFDNTHIQIEQLANDIGLRASLVNNLILRKGKPQMRSLIALYKYFRKLDGASK